MFNKYSPPPKIDPNCVISEYIHFYTKARTGLQDNRVEVRQNQNHNHPIMIYVKLRFV